MNKAIKVKVIDFEATARVNDDFKGKVGLADLERRIVWVDKRLPEFTNGSRELTKRHELAHILLTDCKLKFAAQVTENLCELIGIVTARNPRKTLTHAELVFRHALTEKERLKWVSPQDRQKIIYNIFKAIDYEASDRELDILTQAEGE